MQGLTAYQENSCISLSRDELMQVGTQLVHKIAKSVKRKLPSSIDFDDLTQSGFVGLLEAIQNYRPDEGASFETFASIRIKGSIIDELRKNSWYSRDASQGLKKINEAIHRIEQRVLRSAKTEEIVSEMGINIEEYNKICNKINFCNVVDMFNLEVFNLLPASDMDTENEITKDDLISEIKKVINSFKERDQILLSLYYIEELTLKEIGEVLSLSEARVSQIHTVLLAKLKSKI